MLAPFADMRSGKRRRIEAVKHHIELTQDSRRFCFEPYCARPRTRKLKKLEIQKQSKADVIKPATSDWAS